jgi:outer membrane cobalamin receptor
MPKFLLNRLMPFFFVLAIPFATVSAQDHCGASSLDAAGDYYSIGRFEECVATLEKCLGVNGFNYNEKFQAYRLLSMSYLAKDSVGLADNNIKKLLLLQDNFEPYANDPIRFRLEVLYIRQVLRANLISSVSKKAEDINLAPATIQIITAKDIQNRGYQDIESVLYDLPGFDISRNFGITFSTVYQRGYRSATMTERTLLLVDGVESNEIWSNAAMISKQFPVINVKRVEVIYGPASTIYGANAFVGVINIVTKNEEDYFPFSRNASGAKAKTLSVNISSGKSSLNTRYLDLNISKHVNKDVFFSLTGRVYKSDNLDLSKYSRWNGPISQESSVYSKNFLIKNPKRDTVLKFLSADPTKTYFGISPDSSSLFPLPYALAKAGELDNIGYAGPFRGVNTAVFDNSINDIYFSGKARFGDFNFGFEYWNKNEGSIGDYVNRAVTVNSALTNWQMRQYYIYCKYEKIISERVTFSNFTYFRGTDMGDNSKSTSFRGYGNKAISFYDLVKSNGTKLPTFAPTFYFVGSNQFKTEFKLQYKFNEKFDLNSGGEFRTGNNQGDYAKGSVDPAMQFGLVSNGNLLPGGNNFIPYTVGAYSQLNFQDPKRNLNVSAAYRWDFNRFREVAGYGSIFNPRFAVVYYPGKMVFKAIYAEAFMDASSFNKFSYSAARLANNPTLQPEKVKNLEFSAQFNFKKNNPASFVQLAYYKAFYNNTLALVSYTMPTTGVLTNRFDALGKSNISGLQLSTQIQLNKTFSLFGNATYTNPTVTLQSNITKADSITKRTGDIADYSANLGVNVTLLPGDRLNLNFRVNGVGSKPTGSTTSVADNPLSLIDGFTIFHINVGFQVYSWVRLQAGCTNLFDKLYYSPGIRSADNITYASIIPQYGRMFQGQLIFNISK